MRRLSLLILFITIHCCVWAQQFRPRWVNDLGSANGGAAVTDIATDKDNNVYVTGVLSADSIDFDPGTGVKYLRWDGNADAFVGKYKPDGTLIWVESFPSISFNTNSQGNARPIAIAVDKDGNISISGYFVGETLDADPGPGVHNLTPYRQAGFIIHLDTNGNFLWAFDTGDDSIEGAEQVAADSQDNVIVTSTFSGSLVVGDSTYTTPYEIKFGLIVKYSPTGKVLWSISLGNYGGVANERADGCRVDSKDNIIVSGLFNSIVNFNPLGTAFNLTAPNPRESFIAKYAPSGNLTWVDTVNTNANGINYPYVSIIGVDRQDNIYFDAVFRQFVRFGGSVTLNAQGYEDICFAKYTPSGQLIFAKAIGGSPSATLTSFKVVSDKNNNVYLAGYFVHTVNFNPNPGNPQNLQNPGGGIESYVAEYDQNGNYIYAFSSGNSACGYTSAFGLAVDENGNIDACGQFCSTVNFDPTGCSTFNVTAIGTGADGYFVQYAPVTLSNDVIAAPAVTTFCANGTPGAFAGSTPSGGVGGYTYQWQNSADSVNFANIPGANSINYTPPALTATTYYRRVVSQTCASSITSNIVGLHLSSPPAAPQASGDTVCLGTTATLAIVSPQPNLVYNWYASAATDSVLFTGNSFTTLALSATTTYYAEASYGAGSCSSAARTAVTVTILAPLSAPVVTIGPVTATSITFEWTAVPGATGYQVSIDSGKTFSNPSSGPTGLTTVVSGLQPGSSVTVIVEASGGTPCQLSAGSVPVSASIPKNDLIYVPNAFTPNGDGKNDEVHVHSGSIQSLTFYIYDQWGDLLFTSTDLQTGWDGTYRGTKEPVGVYVYLVEAIMIDGKKVTKKGTITLIR